MYADSLEKFRGPRLAQEMEGPPSEELEHNSGSPMQSLPLTIATALVAAHAAVGSKAKDPQMKSRNAVNVKEECSKAHPTSPASS